MELMIGDWVSQSNGNAVKIDWIKTGGYGYYDKYGKMEIACTPLLEPIPLTPEILEKNGWEKEDISTICVEYTFIIGCCDIMVRITNGNAYLELSIFHGAKISMNIQYVHELQHALRLCGLDELSDYFKV